MLAFELIKILVLSSRATSNGIYSSLFATHNERLLYQINNKLITDCHPTYCDQKYLRDFTLFGVRFHYLYAELGTYSIAPVSFIPIPEFL